MGCRTLIVDTHVLLWIDQDHEISREARSRISSAAREGALYFSAISAFEISTMIRRGRLRVASAPEMYIQHLSNLHGLREAPVTAEIARMAGQLSADLHGDPADRIIIATAALLNVSLATRDRNIQDFAKSHGGFSCVRA